MKNTRYINACGFIAINYALLFHVSILKVQVSNANLMCLYTNSDGSCDYFTNVDPTSISTKRRH